MTGLMLVCACSSLYSPDDLRKTPPLVTYVSPKPAKDVALCIVAKWENLGAMAAMRPAETGFQVMTRNQVHGHVQMLADIYESSGGSETRYFKGHVFGEEAFDRALSECQQSG